MEVGFLMTDAECLLSPAAASIPEPWERHGKMLDPSQSHEKGTGRCWIHPRAVGRAREDAGSTGRAWEDAGSMGRCWIHGKKMLDPREGHGKMLDLWEDTGSIPEPGLCSGSSHRAGWGCTAMGRSPHGTLRSRSPLLCLFFFNPPLSK